MTFVAGLPSGRHDVGMSTIRRFLVLAPVALAVTLLAGVVYGVAIGGDLADLTNPADLEQVGYLVLGILVVNVLVLAAILVAAVALGWSRLGPAAVLGTALALVAAVAAVYYVNDAPWRGDDEDWDALLVQVALFASVPAWLTYAVGLLVSDRRGRPAVENPAPGPTA